MSDERIAELERIVARHALTIISLRSLLEKIREMVRSQEGVKWDEMLWAIDAVLDGYAIEKMLR